MNLAVKMGIRMCNNNLHIFFLILPEAINGLLLNQWLFILYTKNPAQARSWTTTNSSCSNFARTVVDRLYLILTDSSYNVLYPFNLHTCQQTLVNGVRKNYLDKVVRDMHVALDALSQGLYESGLHGTNSQML